MSRIIKAGTKQAEQMLRRANIVEGRTLYEIYGKVSSAKMRAYEDCLAWYRHDNGKNFRICSHNSFSYSVAWELDWVNPETGEVIPATRIETSQNSYLVLRKEVA